MTSTNPVIKKSNETKKKPAKPMRKSTVTLWYENRKTKVYAFADKTRVAFFGDSWVATLMWLFVAFVCLALLAWFFFISPFGTPTEPIYEGF